jgi:hypothetical protein
MRRPRWLGRVVTGGLGLMSGGGLPGPPAGHSARCAERRVPQNDETAQMREAARWLLPRQIWARTRSRVLRVLRSSLAHSHRAINGRRSSVRKGGSQRRDPAGWSLMDDRRNVDHAREVGGHQPELAVRKVTTNDRSKWRR